MYNVSLTIVSAVTMPRLIGSFSHVYMSPYATVNGETLQPSTVEGSNFRQDDDEEESIFTKHTKHHAPATVTATWIDGYHDRGRNRSEDENQQGRVDNSDSNEDKNENDSSSSSSSDTINNALLRNDIRDEDSKKKKHPNANHRSSIAIRFDLTDGGDTVRTTTVMRRRQRQ